MKKNLVLSLILSFALSAYAQDYVDLAKIYYQNTPANNFEDILGSTELQEFGADLTLPIKLESGNAIITGITYNSASLSLYEGADINVQDIALKVGMSINHSDRLNGTYILLPKLSSDFEKVGSDDFQMGGVAILKLKKNENFKYKFGLYYNSELFGAFFVPFVGCYYISDSKKFELDLSLPIAADANYKLMKDLRIGLRYGTGTKSFNLNKTYTFNDDNYQDTYVKKYTIEAFSYLQYTIAESFLLYANVGYSVGRVFEVSQNSDKNDLSILSIGFGDDPKVLNSPFEDGLIYRFGFRYRFNIKKE